MKTQPTLDQPAIEQTIKALARRVNDPAQDQKFRDLCDLLASIRRFRRLPEGDQLLLTALMEYAATDRELSTIDSYVRQILRAVDELSDPDGPPQLMSLFEDSATYRRMGVWTVASDAKFNARVAGVKAAMDAAVGLDIASTNHLADLKTKKRSHNPRPASEESLREAVAKAIDSFRSEVGFWAIIAFRNLVLLDWKSYGPRS